MIDYGPYPLHIDGLGDVTSAAAGETDNCVIEVNHTVKCWGSNVSGYVLGPNVGTNSATPLAITGLPGGG